MNRWEQVAIWLLASGLATAGVAWVAFQLQQQSIAPAVLFPLLVGAAVGGATAAARNWCGQPARKLVVIAALCWGLLAVVGQDYIGHRHLTRRKAEELARQSPLAAAAISQQELWQNSFGAHLAARVRAEPWWWSLDLLLTALASAAVAALGVRPTAKDAVQQGTT